MNNARILVMDDESKERGRIESFLKRKGYEVTSIDTATGAIEAMKRDRFDVLLTDCAIPGVDALHMSSDAHRVSPDTTVVIMTAFGTIETAVKAIKAGAYDYLPKPIDLDQLAVLIGRITERQNLLRENAQLRQQLIDRYAFDGITSTSHAMEEVLNLAGRVAVSNATVLLRGESGTGKELIARAIHYHSRRADKPLVKVNCAALPETLLESELFGHERGAFTGAATRRLGRFEAADQGTMFLDEIGDLSPGVQVKLLRVLQEKEFERLGGNETIKVDVRLIAATNRDLEAAIREGKFREDLYYRLNVVTVSIPPLRERKEDIPALVEHFIRKYSLENRKKISGVSSEARELLLRYSYPGNVRELENFIERAVVLSKGGYLTTADLPIHIRTSESEERICVSKKEASLNDTLDTLERGLILSALKEAGGVQTRAAEMLGISERVLRYKLRKYKIRER
jgi:two-component system NtrC family response regulator